MATRNKHQGKTIAVSGGFDPVHIGHLGMFEAAKNIVGDKGTLIVFVNSDSFLKKKKGKAFMKLNDRIRLVQAFSMVDIVVGVIDKDMTVCATLKKYRPDIFANGGDRTSKNVPEVKLCEELGIEMMFNVGGKKLRSSSKLLGAYKKNS